MTKSETPQSLSCLSLTDTHTEIWQNSECFYWSVTRTVVLMSRTPLQSTKRVIRVIFSSPQITRCVCLRHRCFQYLPSLPPSGWYLCSLTSMQNETAFVFKQIGWRLSHFGICVSNINIFWDIGHDRVFLMCLRLWKPFFWSVDDRCFLMYQFSIVTTTTNSELAFLVYQSECCPQGSSKPNVQQTLQRFIFMYSTNI